ncbi:MAG: TetR/AcrR family transcriptional regulator [Prevotella sp.]|nr:TetR/AcrR family transcriptional regulator [Prevotella sp.]
MQEIKDLTAYRLSLKNKILEAATSAFWHKGIKAVKMDDIASSLSISKRTLYEIYGDKESLLFACIKQKHQERQEFMRVFSEQHNVMEVVLEVYRHKVEELETVNYAVYQDIQLYPNILAYMEQVRISSHDFFLSFMQRGVKEGYFRKDINYELIGKLFDAIGEYVGKEVLYSQYPHEELLSTLMLVPFRGFCTPKGVKMLDSVIKK